MDHEATRWFSQWHVYRSIVDADWMAHRGIFDAIRAWVLLRHPGPFTLLDLGCGDAGFIRSTFDDTGLWSYTGVDASPTALAQAEQELTDARFRVRLLEADMLDFLEPAEGTAAATFDVLLASFAVHHLSRQEKQRFFHAAHAAIAPGGSLLFADIFRQVDEPREGYLDRYLTMMRQAWVGLTPEALAGTIEHVSQRDFPETVEDVAGMARAAGFGAPPREPFVDHTGFHRIMAFTKAAGPVRAIQQPDAYWENGLVVYTAAYHLKRGSCCGSGCRHCPYEPPHVEGSTQVRS